MQMMGIFEVFIRPINSYQKEKDKTVFCFQSQSEALQGILRIGRGGLAALYFGS